jgi:hypothetical protein
MNGRDMRVWIRNRPDGVTELSPPLAPLDRFDRGLVIFTVLLAAGGLFLAGVMPAPVAGAILLSCIAGEVVLGAKALLLALLRPVAEVREVPSWTLRGPTR